MRINYNIPAYTANAKLLQNEDALTRSIEKLSSGFRINRASDDPAGMGISAKMKVQIRGLEQAERNSKDGESVIETAEGALNEVTVMLQRMRELAVQAGNDTYALEDKEAMQDEIEELKKEIDRISTDTEFNKMTLLDGSKASRIYPSSRDSYLFAVSSEVTVGSYEYTIDDVAHEAKVDAGFGAPGSEIPEGTLSINGVNVTIDVLEDEEGNQTYSLSVAGMKIEIEDNTALPTAEEYYAALQQACEIAEVDLSFGPDSTFDYGTNVYFRSKYEGSGEVVSLKFDNEDLAAFYGIPTEGVTEYGSDVKVTLTRVDSGEVGFSKTASCVTSGNTVTIRDRNGFEMSFDVRPGARYDETGAEITDYFPKTVTADVTDLGAMVFQVGANENQVITVDIPEINCRALRIETVDVTTVFGADKAIVAIDNALARVTTARSSLGATENRLNYAVENLEEIQLDMNAALSRIEDVDMAEEMSIYTQQNVLVQAATSVLAQANDLPQQCLQLLQ